MRARIATATDRAAAVPETPGPDQAPLYLAGFQKPANADGAGQIILFSVQRVRVASCGSPDARFGMPGGH